jgi:redox-sensitive bicupin YhaK (pirin superfamily)
VPTSKHRVLRAGERYRTARDGIESWHCFSVGHHYDPDNVAFGALVGVDEHVIAPEHGFDWHPHRGVTIVSWIIAGVLRHEQDGHPARTVRPGEVLIQVTADGIRHRETNASDELLRLLQTTIASDDRDPGTALHRPPVDVAGGQFAVVRADIETSAPRWHAWVISGQWRVDTDGLGPGDSVRGNGPLRATGAGEMALWTQS